MAEKNRANLKRKHHEKKAFCYDRPSYREARWERAVKVYTINLESKYLLIQGVPSVGVTTELLELFALYGAVEEYQILNDYPAEEFTKVYWIKFQKISAARIAKKKLDNKSFFGGILHICYAPEYEKVEDTREKLEERRKVVARKCKEYYGNQLVNQMASTDKSDDSKQNRISQTQETNVHICRKEQLDVTASTQQQSQTQTDTTNITDGSSQLCGTSRVSTVQCDYESHEYNYGFPQLPPPPIQLHPLYFPQPPHPPGDLPHVPTAHATLPLYLQNLPPPPPPPPPAPPPPPSTAPLTVSSAPTAMQETTTSLERTPGKNTCTETSAVSSSEGDRQRTAFILPEKPFQEVKPSTSWKEDNKPHCHISSMPLKLNAVQDPTIEPVVIPPSITGSTSLDMTVQAVRLKMRQISGTTAEISCSEGTGKITSQKEEQRSTTASVGKKKRKRI